MAKRKNYSPNFKARVALAALGNEKTIDHTPPKYTVEKLEFLA